MQKLKGFMVITLAMALAGPALAQPGPGGGMGRGKGPVAYNPQAVTSVTGQVEKLEELPSLGRGGGKGMQHRGVLLKTDQGSLMVDLAPAWYLNDKKFVVQAGDTVSATGSKAMLDNQPGLIARARRQVVCPIRSGWVNICPARKRPPSLYGSLPSVV